MTEYTPKEIFIDSNIRNHWMVSKILNHYPKIPSSIVQSSKEIEALYDDHEDPITEGKKYLYLTKNKGTFLKKCPGTNGFICCSYYVIDLVENCHLECSYCFLQNYLSERMIKINVNVEDLFKELDHLLSNPDRLFRIGTGELSDSLALDNITGFSKLLIEYFSDKKNAVLELKTKTNEIENLKELHPNTRTVLSWSLNPQNIIDREESKTASLDERLKSAQLCLEKGYQLAFHFDPIIYYEDWESDYQKLIDKVFRTINPKKIAWISLGGFRYNPPMDKVITQRFKQSRILYQEFFESPDGKMRYFIKNREKLYRKMLSMIKAKDSDLFVYLCMEGKYMWEKVYGFTPKNENNLDRLFIKRQNKVQESFK